MPSKVQTRRSHELLQLKATSLSNEEILRYSRHLIMPEVGMDGQLKLKNAKVLLHRHRRPGRAARAISRGRWRRPIWASSISTSWISPICNGRSLFGSSDVGKPKIQPPPRLACRV